MRSAQGVFFCVRDGHECQRRLAVVVGALGSALQKVGSRVRKEVLLMKGYHKRRAIVIRVVAALLALLMIASVFSALIFK